MRRQYFVIYNKGFANSYDLVYAETEEDLKLVPVKAERITRKEAEALCAAENSRRKTDQSFSGFADNCIYPVSVVYALEPTDSDDYIDIKMGNSRKYVKNGYIWERRAK